MNRFAQTAGVFFAHPPRVLRIELLWLALLGLGCSSPPPPEEPAKTYNLVVACLDTVRSDTFWLPETAGSEDELAPWLQQGIVLKNTQAPSPWTVPSVASVLTGLYPNQHGAGQFADEIANLDKEVPSGLAQAVASLPEVLSSQGYGTAAFVAHPWFKAGYGLDRGFDSVKLVKRREKILEASFDWLDRQRVSQVPDGAAAPAGPPSTAQPFLLYLHFMEAHGARRLRDEELAETVARLPPDLKPRILAEAPGNVCRKPASIRCQTYQAYIVTVLDLRQTVAELLQGLADRELADDTIVAIFSDHGEEFFDHYDEEKALGLLPKGRFGRGHGHSLYQELLHVPAVIWHPDHQGQILEAPTSLIDLMPSLLEWLAVPSPRPRWPGLQISDLGPSAAEQPPRNLYSSSIAYGPEQIAIRSGEWKHIRHTEQERALFDLERDPTEQSPIEDAEVSTRLDQLLDRYLAFEPALGEAAPEISDEELQRLQSLGYLQGVERSE